MALFTDFQPISKKEWLQKVEKDLKGKPLEGLHWQLNEEIMLTPFYHADDAIDPVGSLAQSRDNLWGIAQTFVVQDHKHSRTNLLAALERGINAPRLILSHWTQEDNFEHLLEDINPTYISIQLQLDTHSDCSPLQLLQQYHQFAIRHAYDPRSLQGGLVLELRPDTTSADMTNIAQAIKFAETQLPLFRVLYIQNTQTAGQTTTVIEDLTEQIHSGIRCLETLQAIGISAERTARQLQFGLHIGKSYFVEIAAIRAFKVLWANTLAAYGCTQYPVYLDATLASHSFGSDQYTNMIRATTQAMSAVVGGIQRLTIPPANSFTTQETSALTERIARNVQHVLQLESHFDRVQDPAAGSYYIEHLTNELVEKVWQRLQADSQ